MPEEPKTIRVPAASFCREFCGLRKDCPIYIAGNSFKQGYQVAKEHLVARTRQAGDGEVLPATLMDLADPEVVEELPRATFLKPGHLAALKPAIEELTRARDTCANHRMVQPAVQVTLLAQQEAQQRAEEEAIAVRQFEAMAKRSPLIRQLLDLVQAEVPSPIAGAHLVRPAAKVEAAPVATPAPTPPPVHVGPAPSAAPHNGSGSTPLRVEEPPAPATATATAPTIIPVAAAPPRNGDHKHAGLLARAKERYGAEMASGLSEVEAIFETYNAFREEKLSHEMLAEALGDPWTKMKVWKAYDREKVRRSGMASGAPKTG